MGECTSSNKERHIKDNSEDNLNDDRKENQKRNNRPRLYSDINSNQNALRSLGNEKLNKIQRHSNYDKYALSPNQEQNTNEENLKSNFSLEDKDEKGNELEYLNDKKLSQFYFKNFIKEHKNNNTILYHLACSIEDNEDNKFLEELAERAKKYLPEYIIDWKISKDENGNISWKDNGKIYLNKQNIEKLITDKVIESTEIFYKKVAYLYNYLKINILKLKRNENIQIQIHRNNILEDSYNQLKHKEANIFLPLKIKFIDEMENGDEGVYKEWYSCLFKMILDKKSKLFMINPRESVDKNTIIFYPYYEGMKLEYYEFIGAIIIKGVVDMMTMKGYKINICICKVVTKKPILLEDIKYYDLSLYKSLKYIKEHKIEGELSETKFTWEINKKQINLIENGDKVFLSEENKDEYINKVIELEIYKNNEKQIKSLQKGLYKFIENSAKIHGMFSAEELQFLVSGQMKINLDDWMENTVYKGKYNKDHQIIKWFWKKIKALKENEKYTFLKFVTGSRSIPIDGFCALRGVKGRIQKFTIEPYRNFNSENPNVYNFRLMESMVCFNLLMLPEYKTEEEIEKAIKIILENDIDYIGL